MRSSPSRRRVLLTSMTLSITLLAAACGTSSPTHSASGTNGKPSNGASSSAEIAQAKAAIAPYVGHPSAFPATETLAHRPPPGSKFVYLQCSTPVCAQIGQLLVAPTKALGVTLSVINAGSTATSTQAAAATALAEKPAAVLIAATDPQLFGGDLHQLTAAGIAVVGVGIIGGAPYGVQETVGGAASTDLAGQLMADWVVAHKGTTANVVFFGTPELSFSAPMQAGFARTLSQRCPSCKATYQQISVTTFASTAPSQVVSYLQAHPQVNTVVFASMEAATGLAAALKDASLNVTTVGFAPTPSNLQDIANGGLTAGLGLDLLVQEWLQVNAAARLIAHQATPQSNLNVDLEFLTKGDINTSDIKLGWTGYPDVAQRFAKLWPSKS
jgi:ribose transport system substrate-binding protein